MTLEVGLQTIWFASYEKQKTCHTTHTYEYPDPQEKDD